jgi:hypothetical protein
MAAAQRPSGIVVAATEVRGEGLGVGERVGEGDGFAAGDPQAETMRTARSRRRFTGLL